MLELQEPISGRYRLQQRLCRGDMSYQIRLDSYHSNQHNWGEIHTKKVHMLSVLIVIKRI